MELKGRRFTLEEGARCRPISPYSSLGRKIATLGFLQNREINATGQAMDKPIYSASGIARDGHGYRSRGIGGESGWPRSVTKKLLIAVQAVIAVIAVIALTIMGVRNLSPSISTSAPSFTSLF